MDKTDIKLLQILQEDGRITLSELSKKLALSRPSVSERLIRLKEKGIINKISATVSPEKLGRNILLYIHVSKLSVSYSHFEKMTAEHPDIFECHRLTGEVHYLLKAAVRDMDHLNKLIDYLIKFGVIHTSIVLKSPVSHKKILPIDDNTPWPFED